LTQPQASNRIFLLKKGFNMAQPGTEEIYRLLRQAGNRLTDPRRAVVRVIVDAERWLRPEEIYQRAQNSSHSLGLVTVYRTLALLSEMGILRRVHFEDGCHGYTRVGTQHGHHLICKRCHQVVEFSGQEHFSALVETISSQSGFVVEDQMLELLGICPACQRDEAPSEMDHAGETLVSDQRSKKEASG
jgi:Fur family transcriptional regulator, ferric uptake regulator